MKRDEAAQGDQEVAVNQQKNGHVTSSRSRQDRLWTRQERLRHVSESRRQPGTDQISKALAALNRVRADGGRTPHHIKIRATFITRREEPDGEMSDRTGSPGLHPPMVEIPSPRGIALQTQLVALFVAQCQTSRHKDGRVSLEVPLDTTDASAVDWVDLVVPHSNHTPRAVYAASRRDNRLRQVKSALDRLVDCGLVELPRAGAARGKYDGFRLLDEGGPRTTGPALAYRVPDLADDVIEVPVEFFLNGWVYVLTSNEIALWLMLMRCRQRIRRGAFAAADPEISIDGDVRQRTYGVTKDAYKSWWLLELAGLVDVTVDDGRRPDGTVTDFDPQAPPDRHTFVLRDDALQLPAAAAVKVALQVALDGEPVGVARIIAQSLSLKTVTTTTA